MVAYVKFISKYSVEVPPKNKDGIINYDVNIPLLIKDGYKELVELDVPVPSDSHIEYVEEETKIREVLVEPSEEARLNTAKAIKQQENIETCQSVRGVMTFELTIQDKYCVFDTSTQTQSDLQTAYMVTSTGAVYPNWVTNNWVKLDLTNSDVLLIYNEFFSKVSPLYTKELRYTEQINACTTVAEVEAIVIDYSIDLEEEEIDYSKFTVAQLKAMADERNIQYASNILKADLIKLLEGDN